MHDIARIRHDKEDILFEPLNYDWWNDKHLKGSGLKVVEIDESTNLIAGTSSELKTYLAAHAHDPRLFSGADKAHPNNGRLKRHWTGAEAEGCGAYL